MANRQRLLALYARGPTAGDWPASARLAGFDEPPPMADYRNDLLAIGMPIEGDLRVPLVPTVQPVSVAVSQIPPAPDLADLPLPDPNDPDSATKWQDLGRAALPIWREAALGLRKLTPTQKAALQDIITRAFGKPGTVVAEAATETPTAIVILPALQDGAAMQVCPECRARLGGPAEAL